MHATFLISLLPLLACASSPFVVHEKRDADATENWKKLEKLDSGAVIPFRFGLKQSNLELGDAWLMDIADPASSNYGNHWTAEQVIDAFRPSHETVQTVHNWLNEAGVESSRHVLTEALNWVEVHLTIEEAERLMDAKYHVFQQSGTRHVACDSYSLPAHVQPHIDFVSPGVHFDSKVVSDYKHSDVQGDKFVKRGDGVEPNDPGQAGPWHHGPGRGRPWHPPPNSGNLCNDSFVTPYCIRTLYNIPTDLTPAEGNSVGIVELTPETYLQSDLKTFFELYEPRAVNETPKFDSIDGGFLYRGFNETTAFGYLGEPSLDLQYAMALLYPQNVVLYQVGDLAEASKTSFNNFLDAIDKSYCTYDGGDDPRYDATYPDPYPGPHSYKGPPDCGTYAPTKVISISYGTPESALPEFYQRRQCNEYLKLALMGTTTPIASGDYGVSSANRGRCLGSNGRLHSRKSGKFVPDNPATCPYVLAVGATQIINHTANVVEQVHAGKQVEMVMELYINETDLSFVDVPPNTHVGDELIFSSSGGYSNIFELPAYQKAAVTAYNKKYRPSYPGKYNTSNVRAFPDVSSNGAWLNVIIDGHFMPVFGTSCAAPTWAAIIGLINGERLKAGKKSVGFINPALYAHPEVLHDVTLGANPGCGTQGFPAAPGWDAVTGLGTPNFPAMLKLFMSLP